MRLIDPRLLVATLAFCAFLALPFAAKASTVKTTPDPAFAHEFVSYYNELNTAGEHVEGVGCKAFVYDGLNVESCIGHETTTDVYFTALIDADAFKLVRKKDPIAAVIGMTRDTKAWYTKTYKAWLALVKSIGTRGGTA